MKKIKLKTLIESLVREEMQSTSGPSPVVYLLEAIEDMENGAEVAELLVDILQDQSLVKATLSRLNDYLADQTSSEEGEEGESMSAKDFGVGRDLDRATGVRTGR